MTSGLLGRAFSCSVRVSGWSMALLDLCLLVYCWLLHTIGDGVWPVAYTVLLVAGLGFVALAALQGPLSTHSMESKKSLVASSYQAPGSLSKEDNRTYSSDVGRD